MQNSTQNTLSSHNPVERFLLFSMSVRLMRLYMRNAFQYAKEDKRPECKTALEMMARYFQEASLFVASEEQATQEFDQPKPCNSWILFLIILDCPIH